MCALPVVKSVPLSLDRQAGADEVTFSAEIIALHWQQRASERLVRVEVKVLVFKTENHVDQWSFMDHVVESAARVPARATSRARVPSQALPSAELAKRALEISRRVAAAAEQ
jgi:hypothetical protein